MSSKLRPGRSPRWRGPMIAVLVATLPCLSSLGPAACASHEIAPTLAISRRGELALAWARAHLEESWDGYGILDDMGARAFDIVILSHLAVGIANVAVIEPARGEGLRPMIDEVVRRAVSARVSPIRKPARSASIGDHNLYASHLLLILGIAHRLGVTEHDALAETLARHLHQRSMASPDFHARSYPRSPRWPADQSVTLAALDFHDRQHATSLARAPIAGWLGWIAAHETDGLPWSTTGALSYARVPRGCALSWMTQYMGQFAPDEGAALYARYRARHAIDWLGWRGFRKWPPGVHRGSDIDAGPVIFGWGTGAARMYGDGEQYAGIERIADTVGLGVPGSGRYLFAPTLGQAILFAGETATFWHERPARLARTESGWPIAPAIALFCVLALDAWLLRALARRCAQP